MIPSEKVLIAIAGSFLTREFNLKYCHVEKVYTLDLEEHSFVVSVFLIYKSGISENIRLKLWFRRNQGRYMAYKYSHI